MLARLVHERKEKGRVIKGQNRRQGWKFVVVQSSEYEVISILVDEYELWRLRLLLVFSSWIEIQGKKGVKQLGLPSMKKASRFRLETQQKKAHKTH